MIIYNVTVKITKSAEAEWMKWMKEIHIPALMATGDFISYHFYTLLNQPDDADGSKYVIQYQCATLHNLDHYLAHFAPALQKEYNEKFNGLFVISRTVMEEV